MNRRNFLHGVGTLTTGALLFKPQVLSALPADKYPELAKHKIQSADVVSVDYHWPRFVGKNGARDVHGQNQKASLLVLKTQQGAQGWGLTDPKTVESASELIGKRVIDLITPESGLAEGLNVFRYDFA
ncbi:MAG: hypothetical protein ABUL44_04860, partial [Flavobacterium sp.]